jgi:hypothetical protein
MLTTVTRLRRDDVIEVTAAVGDFDSGLTWQDSKSTWSRTSMSCTPRISSLPNPPKWRVVMPLAIPVPTPEWPEVKGRIDATSLDDPQGD